MCEKSQKHSFSTLKPALILIQNIEGKVQTMGVKHLYLKVNYSDPEWLAERAILAPLNEIVRSINKKMIEMMPGGSTKFTSIDSTITEEEAGHYPTEFLNSIEIAGLPSHKLNIKIAMPVVRMRSLASPRMERDVLLSNSLQIQ
ncbi:hypothetical protein RRG08_013671 [Elysia crispata]|uniref:ATP-dependent DNA helicase n=1 Tax=Elysia crispata TaxID=231223 RepID=A0AAE1DQW0_9GAST|nr:hypothetical protein RRG08_013671 [Elysia crispata]